MARWLEIDAARIAADEPPRAELGVALAERDRCNATKILPHTSTPTGSTTSETWTDLLTWRLHVPADVPDGALLYWPVRIHVSGPTGATNPGEYRLRLGGEYSDLVSTLSLSYEDVTLSVAVDASLRGTDADLVLEARVPDNDPLAPPGDKTHAYAASAGASHRCLASIRRP